MRDDSKDTLKRLDRLSRERAMKTARELRRMGAHSNFVRQAVMAARSANRALLSR